MGRPPTHSSVSGRCPIVSITGHLLQSSRARNLAFVHSEFVHMIRHATRYHVA